MSAALPERTGVTRPARAADCEALAALCAEHAWFEGSPYRAAGHAERLRAALAEQPPRLYAWVAEHGASLVGYATATLDFSTWAGAAYLHMDCLYLRKAARGRGLGRALLDEVIQQADRLGCSRIEWQTPAWNEDASRFYERVGATWALKRRFLLHADVVGKGRPARARVSRGSPAGWPSLPSRTDLSSSD